MGLLISLLSILFFGLVKLTNLKTISIRCFIWSNIKYNLYYVFCFEEDNSYPKMPFLTKTPKVKIINIFFWH